MDYEFKKDECGKMLCRKVGEWREVNNPTEVTFSGVCDFDKVSISDAIRSVGTHINKAPITIDDVTADSGSTYKCVCIGLPYCNKKQTFEVFDYIKRFCKKYPKSFPIHETRNGRFTYIAYIP